MVGKSIVTGYNAFPDICKGTSFWMDVYLSPEAAMRGYINAPSQGQFEKMLTLTGEWRGEWKNDANENRTGMLRFFRDGEYLKTSLEVNSNGKVYDNVVIRLFGDYFHLTIYDLLADGTTEMILSFELEMFNNTTLLGRVLDVEKGAYFTKINV